MNRPEVHDVLRRWRALADREDPRRILVGETYVLDLDQLIPFYGTGEDELNLAFNFLFVHAELDAAELRTIVEGVEAKLPAGAWPVYTGSNHDAGRLATRWAGDDPRRARAALLMLLTLRGTPFLYYGDELGLPEVETDWRTALDPVARRTGDPSRNRDGCRTPMPWTDAPGGGFTPEAATPWLPFGDLAINVEAQRDDPGSTLHLVRDLIALRRAHADLRAGAYATLPAPDGAWAWRRGDGFAVALNLSAADVRDRRARRADRDRHRPRARRRGDRRGARARAVGGRRRGAGAMIDALDPLLSDEGWPYASLPPQEPGDPGRFHALFGRDSLITALQVLPAAPEVARATLRALAARQGDADDPEIDEEPGKILHEYRPESRPRLRGGRLAGARRRAPLLRHGRRDELVPRSCSTRSATPRSPRSSSRHGAPRPAGCARALDAGGGFVRYGPRRGRGRPGAAGLARRDGAGRGASARRRHPPRRTAPAPRRRSPTPTARPPPSPRCDALARLDPGGDWPARAAALRGGRRRAGGRTCSRWRPTARPVPGAGSSLGWLLWAGALEGDAADGRGGPARRARRPHRLRAADARGERRRVHARTPITAARSGRSTPGWAGAGCAPPGATRRPSASAPACSPRSTGSGRAPELYAVTRGRRARADRRGEPRPGLDRRRALGARAGLGRAALTGGANPHPNSRDCVRLS